MSTIDVAAPAKHSAGFLLQAILSFGISLSGLLIGIAVLPIDPWVRGFLAIAALFLVSSTITISKILRDRDEATVVYRRADQARLEKLLTDYDPVAGHEMAPIWSAPSPYAMQAPPPAPVMTGGQVPGPGTKS